MLKCYIKKMFYTLLVCCLLLSMVGCSGGKEPVINEEEADGNPNYAENSQQSVEEPEPKVDELTLENGDVRLVYAGDNVLAVVFHGPYRDIGFHFCYKDGSNLEEEMLLGYGDLNPGWTLGITYKFSEQYSVDELGLSVSDYDAEKNADGTYANRAFPIGAAMTDVELKTAGFDFLDGCCCIVGTGRATYGWDNFGINWGVTWLCDAYDRETEKVDIEGFRDKVEFFVGNGIPLAEYAEGYVLEIKWFNDSGLMALLRQSGDEDNKEKHKKMCDELKAAGPYLVYTNKDGTTQEFPLLQE